MDDCGVPGSQSEFFFFFFDSLGSFSLMCTENALPLILPVIFGSLWLQVT